jgi:hypothetical protein
MLWFAVVFSCTPSFGSKGVGALPALAALFFFSSFFLAPFFF